MAYCSQEFPEFPEPIFCPDLLPLLFPVFGNNASRLIAYAGSGGGGAHQQLQTETS